MFENNVIKFSFDLTMNCDIVVNNIKYNYKKNCFIIV